MLARWPAAAAYCAELVALREYKHQKEENIGAILKGNAHWQALVFWLHAQERGELDEHWLDTARDEPLLLPALRSLTNWSAIADFPAVMIRAAKRVAGLQVPPEKQPYLAEWRLECERSFRDELSAKTVDGVTALVNVPVALAYEKDAEKDATLGLAWLELETLAGDGDIVPHPGDVWATIRRDEEQQPEKRTEATFAEAMSLAFRGARELAGLTKPVRGRWRILGFGEQAPPIPIISGESAGGAALLGWYRAMTQTVVYPSVLVMAAVREPVSPSAPWRLAEVGAIDKKVRAIIDASVNIDTVATVGRCVALAKAAKAAVASEKRRKVDLKIVKLEQDVIRSAIDAG
jgi:hypothetical protein